MTPPNQTERRRSQLDLERLWESFADHTRIDDVHHRENIERIDEISKEIRCIVREMTNFRKEYEPVLKTIKDNDMQWKDLKWTVFKATLTAGVIWFFGAVGVGTWYFYIGAHLK